MRPRLLDLFCGPGVGAAGYRCAGWYVVGVDIIDQPHYAGDEFVRMDVLEYLHPWQRRLDFDAVHASPPCTFATRYRRTGRVRAAENLIPITRRLLRDSRLPYVIENVELARDHLIEPVLLCGSMFDLDVQRHRLFETNWGLTPTAWPCRHHIWTPRFPAATNRAENSRRTVEVGVRRIPLETQKRAMGVDWTLSREELSLGIPPAYTEFIGAQLLAHIQAGAEEPATPKKGDGSFAATSQP